MKLIFGASDKQKVIQQTRTAQAVSSLSISSQLHLVICTVVSFIQLFINWNIIDNSWEIFPVSSCWIILARSELIERAVVVLVRERNQAWLVPARGGAGLARPCHSSSLRLTRSARPGPAVRRPLPPAWHWPCSALLASLHTLSRHERRCLAVTPAGGHEADWLVAGTAVLSYCPMGGTVDCPGQVSHPGQVHHHHHHHHHHHYY